MYLILWPLPMHEELYDLTSFAQTLIIPVIIIIRVCPYFITFAIKKITLLRRRRRRRRKRRRRLSLIHISEPTRLA